MLLPVRNMHVCGCLCIYAYTCVYICVCVCVLSLTYAFTCICTDRMDFPGGSDDKESASNAGDPGSIPGVRKIPWRRVWQPTTVFLPGESHGQRSLTGYSPWGHKESDMTEAT